MVNEGTWRQRGFGYLEVVVVLSVILLIGLSGYIVYRGRLHHSSTSSSSSMQSSAVDASPYGFTVADSIDQDLVDRYKQLNISWVRLQLPWERIETSRGVYNWSELDKQIKFANQNNLHVSFVLQGSPSWERSSTCPNEETPDAMGTFAGMVAKRYNGQSGSQGTISSIEIGNEEFTGFQDALPQPCWSADNYYPVLKAGYQAVKANYPNLLVGTFGSAWLNVPGIQTFYSRLYQLGGRAYFDFANLHYYNHNKDTNEDPSKISGAKKADPTFDQRWQSVYSVMQQNGDGQKPLWITETGFRARPDKNKPNDVIISPDTEAQYLTYELTEAMNSHAVKKIFWYTIDTANSLYHDQSADIYPNYPSNHTPLPAFAAYKDFVAVHPTWE